MLKAVMYIQSNQIYRVQQQANYLNRIWFHQSSSASLFQAQAELLQLSVVAQVELIATQERQIGPFSYSINKDFLKHNEVKNASSVCKWRQYLCLCSCLYENSKAMASIKQDWLYQGHICVLVNLVLTYGKAVVTSYKHTTRLGLQPLHDPILFSPHCLHRTSLRVVISKAWYGTLWQKALKSNRDACTKPEAFAIHERVAKEKKKSQLLLKE